MSYGISMFRSVSRRVTIGLAAVALSAAAAVLAPGLGAAAPQSEPMTVDGLLELYPGSKQFDVTSVEIEPGVVVSLPAEDGVQASCTYQYLCLFSNTSHGGYKISFYTCAFRNLGNYTYPGGGRWNDKMSSLINNQTSGTRSPFYNYLGSNNWSLRFTSIAFNSRTSLGSSNNLIDGVRVC